MPPQWKKPGAGEKFGNLFFCASEAREKILGSFFLKKWRFFQNLTKIFKTPQRKKAAAGEKFSDQFFIFVRPNFHFGLIPPWKNLTITYEPNHMSATIDWYFWHRKQLLKVHLKGQKYTHTLRNSLLFNILEFCWKLNLEKWFSNNFWILEGKLNLLHLHAKRCKTNQFLWVYFQIMPSFYFFRDFSNN